MENVETNPALRDLTDLVEAFPGHYWPAEIEFDRLWRECVLVLDASVLLSFYRYSQATQDALIKVLSRFVDRIFVPHQAALEFHRNRLTVMRQQIDTYAEIEDELRKSMEQLRQRAGQLRRHPILEAAEVLSRVDKFEEELRTYVDRRRAQHPNPEPSAESLMRDEIRDKISVLIGSSVGHPYSEEEQQRLEAESAKRFERQVPPGYRDAKKGAERRYGDAIFWFQTLDHLRDQALPLIVVTEDEKDDWWWRFDGKTLGPRPELVAEATKASGQPMFMYTVRSFLESARKYTSEKVSDEAIDEVKIVANETWTRKTREEVGCPHCDWSPLSVELGTSPGSSAITRCRNCEHRFHIHRQGDGSVDTSKGSLGRRVIVDCPECQDRVWVDFFAGEQGPKARVCLNCYSMINIYTNGSADIEGYTRVVDSEALDERHISCSRCEFPHGTFAQRSNQIFAICNSHEPVLLLRASATHGD